ncbi:MAG: phosphoribosylglycinamide synthetase C domain-containing protein, partial [Pseudomonadota bacterium]|nr:phosphoribosylglycinamide synthetase C domain-containing protein [Pseudomonadota bacterium]
RFGDPETQPIMMRLKSDLVALCNSALDGKLDQTTVEWDKRAALGVVLAAADYPGDYPKGDVINGLDGADSADARIFHAGTALKDDDVVTAGGRVFCAVGLGNSVHEAQTNAYALCKKISWKGMFYRHDIGYRAVAREQNK